MRIISDFHDYYDCIQGMGQDQDLIYFRRLIEESYEGKDMPFGDLPKFYDSVVLHPPTGRSNFYNAISVRMRVVGFCGKVYPILNMHLERSSGDQFNATCFNMEETEAFMVQALKKRDFENYESNHKSAAWRRRSGGVLSGRNRKVYKEFWQKWGEKQNAFQNLFDEQKVPLFVADYGTNPYHDSRRKITFNGCLKEVEFFRIVEPFTAFQELSMYWGNVAQPNRPIPEVSDEDMLVAKGFDPKWSFRKEPSKK